MKYCRGLLFGLGLVILLVVGGCRSVAPTTTTIVRDSIITKTETKYKTLPGDTVRITKQLECDEKGKIKPVIIKKNKGLIGEKIEIKPTGEIETKCWCDSLLKQRDTWIEHLHKESKSELKPVYIHTPYWYDMVARWIAGITIMAVILFFVYIILKMNFKFL